MQSLHAQWTEMVDSSRKQRMSKHRSEKLQGQLEEKLNLYEARVPGVAGADAEQRLQHVQQEMLALTRKMRTQQV